MVLKLLLTVGYGRFWGGGVSWVSVSVVSKLHVYTTVIQFNILLQNKISQQASSIEL